MIQFQLNHQVITISSDIVDNLEKMVFCNKIESGYEK